MKHMTLTDTRPKPLADLIEEARLVHVSRYCPLPADIADGLSRLSRETAQSLGATQAAVSFVNETSVWLGGAFGFDRPQSPREHSFCDAVVRSAAPLLVADGRADPRFRDHEFVRGQPALRSYAGAPLVDGGGYTLGTVAVYSVVPAAFPAAVVRDLSALATLVRDFLADAGDTPPPPRKVQGWLGVRTIQVKATETRASGPDGLVVVSVARRSPAAEAGLRPTDILHAIDGHEVAATADVAAAMAGRPTGSRVQVSFRRAGQWQCCEVEVRPRRRSVRASSG